ncbi:MAG: RNA pyrophosphohydrolase [Chlamydiae bacterium]|nr:RNA pyrophosphohydrolase [Chlamydiota bacterium]
MESVSCAIFDKKKEKILLIKRRDIPVWVLPGGGIEEDEKPEMAALREAFEETGCKTEISRKVAYYQPANRLTRPTHFYECTVSGGTPSIGPETKEIAFFPLEALPKMLVPFYKTWIEDARKEKREVIEKKIEKTSYWTFIHYLLTHPLLVIRFLLTRIGIHINR